MSIGSNNYRIKVRLMNTGDKNWIKTLQKSIAGGSLCCIGNCAAKMEENLSEREEDCKGYPANIDPT